MSGDKHLQLLSSAKGAAGRLHADTSVDPETTRESLKELLEHIQGLIDTMDDI